MPPWQILVLRSDKWQKCPYCGSPVVTAPSLDADLEEQIQHYVSVHEYRKPEITEEKNPEGKIVRVTILHHD